VPAYLGVGRLQRDGVAWHGWLLAAVGPRHPGDHRRANGADAETATAQHRHLNQPPRPHLTARPCLAALRAARQGWPHDPKPKIPGTASSQPENSASWQPPTLIAVYEDVGTPPWNRFARLDGSGEVFVAGFQTLGGLTLWAPA